MKMTPGELLAYIVTHHRWVVVCFFLMPASFILNTATMLYNWISFKWSSLQSFSREHHDTRVGKVQQSVRDWIASGKKTKLCSARPGWQTMSLRIGKYKKTSTGIPVSHLRHVVEVNTDRQTVFVEPNCNMGQITATLNPLGWTLPVLPELDDLTVGGLVCGVGVETSSHKYGLFTHICVRYEIVLADGTLQRCSAEENEELFRAIPWSHGTLGFLVGVEIKIMKCKEWVQVSYEPYNKKESCLKACNTYFNSDFDFVEALLYSPQESVVMVGKMVDKPDPTKGKVNRIGSYYKPWFFSHVAGFLKTGKAVEYIPLRDYYHRHTKSLFWEIQDIITFGNEPWFRYLFGWLMPPHIALMKRTQTEALRKLYELHHVVQDMLIPVKHLDEALTVLDEEFLVYPIWICPMRIFKEDAGFVHPTKNKEEMFVDVGIYGIPKSKKFVAKDSTVRVEAHVRRFEGFQMLYADMYQTREEFREMFDHSKLDKMRATLPGCKEAFPEVYDKVSKSSRY